MAAADKALSDAEANLAVAKAGESKGNGGVKEHTDFVPAVPGKKGVTVAPTSTKGGSNTGSNVASTKSGVVASSTSASGKAAPKAAAATTLPQTNEANSQVAVLGLLGAMGALFGLAGTRRKRQF